ncbi:S26 family signal peptidase [Phenylobacterium sp.]|uniref:S26 family signal peptidase n=1 Tax=Phenylobacterium sp. TaxID=1871053 RepID=UPI002FCAA14A
MTRRPIIAAFGLLGLVALGAPRLMGGPPSLIWNTTASAPEGLYRLRPSQALHAGDLVAVRPPEPLAAWLAQRNALPPGVLLIKRVAALAPSMVCRREAQVTIDGALAARASLADRQGRPLPSWRGCRRLGQGDVFLLNTAAGSLDGRYFGPLKRDAVVGRVTPLWLSKVSADGA